MTHVSCAANPGLRGVRAGSGHARVPSAARPRAGRVLPGGSGAEPARHDRHAGVLQRPGRTRCRDTGRGAGALPEPGGGGCAAVQQRACAHRHRQAAPRAACCPGKPVARGSLRPPWLERVSPPAYAPRQGRRDRAHERRVEPRRRGAGGCAVTAAAASAAHPPSPRIGLVSRTEDRARRRRSVRKRASPCPGGSGMTGYRPMRRSPACFRPRRALRDTAIRGRA